MLPNCQRMSVELPSGIGQLIGLGGGGGSSSHQTSSTLTAPAHRFKMHVIPSAPPKPQRLRCMLFDPSPLLRA
jgi:hypothetical protein